MRRMDSPLLTRGEKLRGRRLLTVYEWVNAISYLLLSGNLITLYALRLGASNLFIGIISAFPYLSYFFMFAGRVLVGKMGVRNLMATGWLARALFMLPLFLWPFLWGEGTPATGLLLMLLGLLFFHISRGVGVVGFNPLVGAISEGKDRGAVLSRLPIFNSLGQMTGGVLIILVLGATAPLSRYTFFIGLGVALGALASTLIRRMPQPAPREEEGKGDLLAAMRRAFRRRSFRQFILLFFVMCVAIGMSDPFRAVYAKLVYLRSDSEVILFAIVGNIGAIFMGLLSRLLMDRLGAKPLYVFFLAFLATSVIPLVITPSLSGLTLALFLSGMFFFFQIGLVGAQTGAQNYFFGIIRTADFLDLGILYNLCQGFGGAVGALLGGSLLDLLKLLGVGDEGHAFRIYFSVVLCALALILVLASRLKRVGRYGMREALGVIFSPRELRAAALLNKLERSRTADEEVEVIRALAESPSEIAVDNLIEKLHSPRFYVRSEALRALEFLPLSARVVRALLSEVRRREYTTAYIAARIIGRRKITQGARLLRNALGSGDYLLQANAMLALGSFRDRGSIPLIERALRQSHNPLVLTHGVTALEELGSIDSIPLLLEILADKNPPAQLRDEILLSIGGLLGMGGWLYGTYAAFLEDPAEGYQDLSDHLAAYYSQGAPLPMEEAGSLLGRLRNNEPGVGEASERALLLLATRTYLPAFGASGGEGNTASGGGGTARQISRALNLENFAEAVRDPGLMKLERFRFFIAALLVFSMSRE